MSTYKVALLLQLSDSFYRELIRGFVEYSRLHDPWSFYIAKTDIESESLHLKEWGCEGIVSRVECQKTADRLESINVPIIDFPGEWPRADYYSFASDTKSATLIVDRHEATNMIINHFADRGFVNFAFCGHSDAGWSREYEQEFIGQTGQIGREPILYKPPRLKRDRQWPTEQNHLAEWLRSLPKPVALMAVNDDRGRQIIDTCGISRLKVPEEIAVVGVDDDKLICNLTNPPMSSVALNAFQSGFKAAEVLERMMSGEQSWPKTIEVRATEVVTRTSSDIIAIDVPFVSEAIHIIRHLACKGLNVDMIVREIAVSRRKLEIAFKKILGRSIYAEIRRVKIDRVCHLLLNSDHSLVEISRLSGFATCEYMLQVFRKVKGMTTTQYRTKYRKV